MSCPLRIRIRRGGTTGIFLKPMEMLGLSSSTPATDDTVTLNTPY